ncbi:uncharacterized protein RJT20DRAFT_16991 [Scheffersomyces xylosifermentans]|uniref:uncharacterized protein n=1 Tax=Scheffersomyces xylosifermentans TaxID=1304137 RepID=UPI00315CAC36
MPHIVYDTSRGFCYSTSDSGVDTKRKSPKAVVRSNGFDQLPWNENFPTIDDEDDADEEIQHGLGSAADVEFNSVARKKRLTKSEKKEQRQIKKINAARNKHIKRSQELAESNSKSTQEIDNELFNPFLTRTDLKALYNKIITMASPKEGQQSKEFKIFQYHSIALYSSDLNHILPGEWLNDNNISFVYELIHQLFLKSDDSEKKFNYQIQLLYPSLVQLFLHFPLNDDLESILSVDELKKSKFIFIPLNFIDDYEDVDLEDGNNGDHWALGLLSLLENKLYLYDSMALDNDEISSQSETNLLNELAKRLQSCRNIVKSNKPIEIIRMKCDQQNNFDDCGVYLIMITCYLIKQLLFNEEGVEIDLDISKVRFNALSGRMYMMELIYKMYKYIS